MPPTASKRSHLGDYGATRSSVQMGEGPPGYARNTVRDGVASWHFRELGDLRPLVRAPAYALGRECHRIGAWPEPARLDTPLGPDANGGDPS